MGGKIDRWMERFDTRLIERRSYEMIGEGSADCRRDQWIGDKIKGFIREKDKCF